MKKIDNNLKKSKYMKSKFVLFSFLVGIFIFSCKKENSGNGKGEVQFNLIKQTSNLKSATNDPRASFVLVSIETLEGVKKFDKEKIELFSFGEGNLSKPISLEVGNYKLTEFAVLDSAGNVIYATPVTGSAKAYLVQHPLNIDFTVQKDIVTNLFPEVISVDNATPADFGYFDFSFNILNTFYLAIFNYNPTIKNFEPTNSTLTISDGVSDIFTGSLDSGTNQIPIQTGISNYILKVEKTNYITFIDTFSQAELLATYKSPLIVVLQPDLNAGLVAYYPFNGNANDASNNGNNGTVIGATLTADRFGNANKAYSFNGTSDEIDVPNSSTLQITANITISGWFKTTNTSHIMGIISKLEVADPMHSYKMEIYNCKARAEFWYNHSIPIGGFAASNDTLTNGKWHHVLAEYDGSFIKLFVDGQLNTETPYTGGMQTNSENLYIGWDQNSYLGDRHFEGSIDDIRIYNRALTEYEIQLLYNENNK
jgi:Concanavalin A-like lectin/glucanases superfamily